MSELSDEDLMKSYALGNADAFDHLYLRYERRIFAFLLARLPARKKQIAGDLFQLVWLKLHQGRSNYDSSRMFSTWIFTITLNSIRDHMRSAKSADPIIVDDLDSLDTIEQANNPESTFLSRESLMYVQELLEKLSPEQKDAILLVDVEGFSNAEAAEMTGTTEVAFRKKISRARKMLGELLESGVTSK